ncbi:hypothetical protein P154DRAFT_522252 [Amniculicola lignicola CBS 123094]|uniref:RING-type domain-containing protein n=1 Tax=Amniculicola lignicola CBS 123094 TaxID=1392246 RepID=A0A6A5WNI9_9PLEO|nr:hypothetical protein P154DRAFT_522252 [Amniculicola lignicola CBS 123094]
MSRFFAAHWRSATTPPHRSRNSPLKSLLRHTKSTCPPKSLENVTQNSIHTASAAFTNIPTLSSEWKQEAFPCRESMENDRRTMTPEQLPEYRPTEAINRVCEMRKHVLNIQPSRYQPQPKFTSPPPPAPEFAGKNIRKDSATASTSSAEGYVLDLPDIHADILSLSIFLLRRQHISKPCTICRKHPVGRAWCVHSCGCVYHVKCFRDFDAWMQSSDAVERNEACRQCEALGRVVKGMGRTGFKKRLERMEKSSVPKGGVVMMDRKWGHV